VPDVVGIIDVNIDEELGIYVRFGIPHSAIRAAL